jgi:hypothetical protein
MKTSDLIRRIQSVLTPDLLHPLYRNRPVELHYTTGHCYSASEALYLLLGGKEKGYTPVCATWEPGLSHWWIVDAHSRILDPTKAQFPKALRPFIYKQGKKTGFPSLRLTTQGKQTTNCKATREILRRLKNV